MKNYKENEYTNKEVKRLKTEEKEINEEQAKETKI